MHQRALALASELDVEPAAPLIRSLALATLTRGDFEAACPFGEQLRTRADLDGDDVLWVESAYILGVAAFWQGQLETARSQFEAAVERCRPEHRSEHLLRYWQDPEVFCLLRLAYTLWLLGHEAEAGRTRDEGLTLAERSGHPHTHISTTAWAALLALDQHDDERLRGYVQALGSGDGSQVAAPVRGFADAVAGHLDVLDGRSRDGIERVRSALDDARAAGPSAPGLLAIHMRVLLEACTQGGDTSAGIAVADEALEMGGGTQLWEPEIRRLRAEFLAELGATPGVVQAELTRAFEAAERQGARTIELRIQASIDRLADGTP